MDMQITKKAVKILGGEKVLRCTVRDQMDIIDLINSGIPKKALISLVKHLGMSMHKIVELLPLSKRTIEQYTPIQRFNSVVSEHILQLAELAAHGDYIFDTKEQFCLWLELPNIALGNKSPLSIMNTMPGTDMVIDILGRIEHGVYS